MVLRKAREGCKFFGRASRSPQGTGPLADEASRARFRLHAEGRFDPGGQGMGDKRFIVGRRR